VIQGFHYSDYEDTVVRDVVLFILIDHRYFHEMSANSHQITQNYVQEDSNFLGIQTAHHMLNLTRFCVRLEVFTAVAMKNGIFWDVTPCGSCKNRRFGGT
jgi:hypothetical protein